MVSCVNGPVRPMTVVESYESHKISTALMTVLQQDLLHTPTIASSLELRKMVQNGKLANSWLAQLTGA